MHSYLRPSTSKRKGLVLQGISGSGKTQLALRYVDQYSGEYSNILWISAASSDEVRASFEEAADVLEAMGMSSAVRRSMNRERDRSYVHAYLTNVLEPNWLIVLDSLDSLNIDARAYVPPCDKGSILVITTSADAKRLFKLPAIELSDLDEQSACDLLSSLIRHSEAIVRDDGSNIGVKLSASDILSRC
jgi:hypothetical protein